MTTGCFQLLRRTCRPNYSIARACFTPGTPRQRANLLARVVDQRQKTRQCAENLAAQTLPIMTHCRP